MAYKLTVKQRERLAELSPQYADRVWIVSASRNHVTVWILGDDDGSISEWVFYEKEKHFVQRKGLISIPRLNFALRKATRELWEYAALRALEVIFAIRAAHAEASERKRAKKEAAQVQQRGREPFLPFGHHEMHGRKRV